MNLTQEELQRLADNPIRGINLVVNGIEQGWFNGNIEINSKTHPAILAYNLILGTSNGFTNRLLDATSELHLLHARNVAELSRNMSNQERYGLFSDPANSVLMFAMAVETFEGLSQKVTITQGNFNVSYQELLVPKDSIIPINGYDFSIMNGIKIQFNERSGWRVYYDGETNNPLFPISTNLLDFDFKIYNGRRYLMIRVPVLQLSCSGVENITSNEASGCQGSITYTDNLFAVRAFLVTNSTMTELAVTYDQSNFDPLTPTLALDLDTVNKRYNYEIPDVYISNRLGLGTVRIYTYTTKGALDKDLQDVNPSSIIPNYQDYRYGMGRLNEYSSPLKNASGLIWQAVEVVRGGRNPTSFVAMKRRVIQGRQQRTLPITSNNLEGVAENAGYGAVNTIDYVTGRQFALTKELPKQTNKGFNSPMGCFVGSHMASVTDLLGSGVAMDNGQRVTIPHNVLFDISRPTSLLVNALTKDNYMSMTSEQKADLLADKTLVYTPFYYVIDITDDQVSMRTYHLDGPLVNFQQYLDENSALGLGVGAGSMVIEHREGGYTITIVTKSDNAYKQMDNNQLGMQLSIKPPETSSTANMAGVLVGITETGERIWEFKLDSRFDIDVSDMIYFNNFTQFGSLQDKVRTTLTSLLTFIFTVTGDKDSTNHDIDKLIDDSIFPEEMVGILETRYSVTFGKKLGNIYSRIRPLVGEAQYKRYDADVVETYPTTEYKRDGNGFLVFDGEGKVIPLHLAGEIVRDPNGQPRILYRAGIDIVHVDGKPVELAPRYRQYHWDFVAFDANYMFSNDDYDIAFALETKNYFINVITPDMERLSANALDQTTLFYQPRSKLGYARVVVNSNYEAVKRQDLAFTVTYYLTEAGYRNQVLKDALEVSGPQLLNQALDGKTTVATATLVDTLKNSNTSEQLVTVKLSALAGDTTVDVISNLDDLTGFGIRKRLELTSDGLLSVQEAVETIFYPHDTRMATSIQ